MTAPVASAARISVPPGAALVVAAGVVALLARPWLFPGGAEAHGGRVLLFVALGLAGVLWPLSRAFVCRSGALVAPNAHRIAVVAPLLLGCAAFAVVRLAAGPLARPADLAVVLALNALAAVAEEAFFRRLVYGLLAPWGTGVAVLGSAGLFAVVHVTVWGLWVLPLDLAAGLVLSWQRAASGRWTVPAATHVVANSLAFL